MTKGNENLIHMIRFQPSSSKPPLILLWGVYHLCECCPGPYMQIQDFIMPPARPKEKGGHLFFSIGKKHHQVDEVLPEILWQSAN